MNTIKKTALRLFVASALLSSTMAVNMVVSAADEVAANPPTTITANTQSSALITNKAMKQRKPLQIAEQGIFSVGGVCYKVKAHSIRKIFGKQREQVRHYMRTMRM